MDWLDFIYQTIPWVQFDYDVHMPNHALGLVSGYGFACYTSLRLVSNSDLRKTLNGLKPSA